MISNGCGGIPHRCQCKAIQQSSSFGHPGAAHAARCSRTCRKSQREYADRGLVVIGISIETANPQLQQFVNSQGDKMSYRVAASERVGQELMAMAQVSGIPHSFVVDREGVIQFSGHPADPAFMSAIRKVTIPAQPERRELPRITAGAEELSAKAVRELKQIMDERGVSYAGLSEKRELVDRIRDICANVTYFAKT